MGVDVFDIVLKDNDGMYFAGQMIEGDVVLVITEELKIECKPVKNQDSRFKKGFES